MVRGHATISIIMRQTTRPSARWALPVIVGVILMVLLVVAQPASAIEKIPDPDPVPGSYGLEATKLQPPPKQGATITTPANGASFSSSPITVSGVCPDGLLVEIYNNGVMVGSVMCKGGSFSLEVSLFSGANKLSAMVYDNLGQAGPKSNIAEVTYNNTQFAAFGELVTLTSNFGRRSAPTGSLLSWPLQLSGGTGPYAFSIDWGDGTEAELKSVPQAGAVAINHTYKNAGIYLVHIRVTDTNGVSAFLQVIAVAGGKVDPTATTKKPPKSTMITKVLWVPAALALLLLLPAYWLGRRSQLVTLRNKMLKERDSYKEK